MLVELAVCPNDMPPGGAPNIPGFGAGDSLEAAVAPKLKPSIPKYYKITV